MYGWVVVYVEEKECILFTKSSVKIVEMFHACQRNLK